MGKSPGRWIKTVFFGKKHSKSSFSRNTKHDKKDGAKNTVECVSGNSPVISNPHVIADEGADNIELENAVAHVPCATGTLISMNQGVESQSVSVSLPISDAEMSRQGEAAARVQAAFRGFLARRAFWALKGIIRLQALIRGHLVRRQAVATLRCMKAIVKLQALARGQRVRLTSTYPEIYRKYEIEELQNAKQVNVGAKLQLEKQATNAYIRKLLLSLPTAMPLSLQYDLPEPNSAGNWLERWSLSRFWEPPARPRKVSNVKPQRKQGSSQTVDNESWKSKRNFRKSSVAANGDNGVLTSIELDKPKRNPRKITNHLTEPVQEQLPQNEFERVKRNLRKVSTSVPAASEKSEMETDKAIVNSALLNVSEKEIAISEETLPNSSDTIEKHGLVEPSMKMLTADDPMNVVHDDHPLSESCALENGTEAEITPLTHEEVGSRGDESGKENLKVRKRRSLPAKQEYAENISQNTPTIPSYMAATQSAKAKLRAHGSARFNEDGTEQSYVRRHSLPASTNGKISSMSPRMQKAPQVNGKVGSKANRLSSRDEKVLQPGWRR